jgi:rhodanese-related sulfurtransferase
MDRSLLSVVPTDLYANLGTASAPLLVDVRDAESLRADSRLIVGAFHRPPDDVGHWMKELPSGRSVVTYCSQGRTGSQRTAEALRSEGIKAAYLEGGLSGWEERNLPTRKNLGATTDKWVTRERPKIDRIACPWLISRFINPNAQFIYVPADEVAATAKAAGATPYDVKGTKFGHAGDRCSFDAIVRIFDIRDPALDQVATIVRGADTSRRDLAPQCEGLYAISLGLSAIFPDDHEMLRHGLVIYDALYAWCRRSQVASGGEAVRAQA